MSGWGDYVTASKFKSVIHDLFLEFIERERPRQSYGIVQTWDLDQREALVTYPSDPREDAHTPVRVAIAHVAPTSEGQTVIIDGPKNARRIVAVLGAARIIQNNTLCRLTHSTTDSQSTSGYQSVAFDTVAEDSRGGAMSGTANSILIPEELTGLWLVGGRLSFSAGGASGRMGLRLVNNGNTVAEQMNARDGTNPHALSVTEMVSLTGGTTLTAQSYIASSTSTTRGARSLWALHLGN